MDTTERQNLLESIAAKIADYRQGEIPQPTPDHVERWVRQFDQFDTAYQPVILRELNHALNNYYLPLERVKSFINSMIKSEKIFGPNPRETLYNTEFLRLQANGNSQNELLGLLDHALRTNYGFSTNECGTNLSSYLYLDDGLFSGNTVLRDLERWLPYAKSGSTLYLIFLTVHSAGKDYLLDRDKNTIQDQIEQLNLSVKWRRKFGFDRKDCLWPDKLSGDTRVDNYVDSLINYCQDKPYNPRLFRSEFFFSGEEKVFSSVQGRKIVEQAFLRAGAYIVSLSREPKLQMRPMGYEFLASLGFGAFFITYRNCPNNCPLALWWGDSNMHNAHPFSKWYPLFPKNA